MITNLINNNGNAVKNQFVITDGTTTIFQSYKTIICEVHFGSAFIRLDNKCLNYSRTTSKYLCQFLTQTLFNGSETIHVNDVRRWIKNSRTGFIKLYFCNTWFDVQVRDLNK